ncbi:MAG: GNAT family N-acetyltransferase [Nitrosopumilus sp.]
MVVPSFSSIEPQDLDEIYAIEIECFGNESFSLLEYRRLLSNHNSIPIKAIVKESIIGFVIGVYQMSIRSCTVVTINVKPRFRKKGVGFELMKSLEKGLERLKCGEVILQTRVNNTAALNLFDKLGFSKTSRLLNYYPNGTDGFEMKKITVG